MRATSDERCKDRVQKMQQAIAPAIVEERSASTSIHHHCRHVIHDYLFVDYFADAADMFYASTIIRHIAAAQ